MTITETQVGWARLSPDGTRVEKKRPLNDPPSLEQNAGKPYWVPSYRIIDDSSTGDDKFSEKRTQEIAADKQSVIVQRIIIRDMTLNEINARKARIVDGSELAININKALMKVTFNLHTRIQTLEGVTPDTWTEFKNKLRALL